MRVSVFGSASATETEQAYRHGQELGALIAAEGWTVCTGGYDGTMAAVSRGAHERGGHVIGVTMESWAKFEIRANPWVREEIVTTGLLARLGRLLESDAFIGLHGGIGTLTEITLAWQLLQAWEIAPAPLVVIGEPWREIIGTFERNLVMRPGDLALLRVVDTPAEAIDHLRRFDRELAREERSRIFAELVRKRGRG